MGCFSSKHVSSPGSQRPTSQRLASQKPGIGGAIEEIVQDVTGQARAMAEVAIENWSEQLSKKLGDALAIHDHDQINMMLDGAMSVGAIGKYAPEVVAQAARRQASHQLREAIHSENGAQLKGAIVAANRLEATDVPEFAEAVAKYHQLKRLPDHWDASKMALGRKGDKMVDKTEILDVAIIEQFQELVNTTFRNIWTRDRGKDQQVPEGLFVHSVIDVHNDELWIDYMARREIIRREVTSDTSHFFEISADTGEGDSGVVRELPGPQLDSSVNEVLLFHGTSKIAAEAITTKAYKVNLAGSHTGTLYGRGIYFAENSSKSDEYSKEDASGLRTLILCRCTLGRPYYTVEVQPDPRKCEEVCINGHFHSILGDRKAARGTYREFIIFDQEQVYPNYIIRYRRKMKTGKR